MNTNNIIAFDTILVCLILMATFICECAVCGSSLQNPNCMKPIYVEYKCRDAKTNREMYIGEVFNRVGQCVRVQCLADLQIWEDRCNVPNLEGDCSEIAPDNEFLNYPKCCPKYKCKIYRNDEERTEEIRIHDHYGNRISTYVTQIFTRIVDSGITGGDNTRNKNPVVTHLHV